MEIYNKTIVPEEKLELYQEDFESYTLQANLLDCIKEILVVSKYTEAFEMETKNSYQVSNYMTDSAIINVALFYFLELINNPIDLLDALYINDKEIYEKLGVMSRPFLLIDGFKGVFEKNFSEEEISYSSIKEKMLEEKIKIENEISKLRREYE